MRWYLEPRRDFLDTLKYYGQEKLSALDLVLVRSQREPRLLEHKEEATRCIANFMLGLSDATREVFLVQYFIQSGFIERPKGWRSDINAPL
jgi:hypothetical protein